MTRTLAGHLEDLDLDEVARVIALSRRSGVLSIESSDDDAELFFQGGRIVSVRSSKHQTTAAGILLQQGILTESDIPYTGQTRTLDDILREADAKRPGPRSLIQRADEILLAHLCEVVGQILLYRSGRFAFQVTEEDGPPPRYPQDTAITVATGADTEILAEQARTRRKRRERDPLLAFSGNKKRDSQICELCLASLDGDFFQTVNGALPGDGLTLRHVGGAADAMACLDELGTTPGHKVLYCDLVMPRPNGQGILGGLHILRAANERGCAERVFLVLDEPHPDAEQMASFLGAGGTVFRDKNALTLNDLAPFLNPALQLFGHEPIAQRAGDLVDKLRTELSDPLEDWQRLALGHADDHRSLVVLKELLGELRDPSFEEEIPLLVLRFTSAFFSRGILFHLRDPDLVGMGAFGLGQGDAGRAVRKIRIPMDADSVFTRPLREGIGIRQPYYDSEWNQYLMGAISGPRPREVYTAPLISARGVEAILFADNALDLRPFPDLSLLEIFLQQSGSAIERWALKQRLAALQA